MAGMLALTCIVQRAGKSARSTLFRPSRRRARRYSPMAAVCSCRDVSLSGVSYSTSFAPFLRCASLLAVGGEAHVAVKSVSLGVSEVQRWIGNKGKFTHNLAASVRKS